MSDPIHQQQTSADPFGNAVQESIGRLVGDTDTHQQAVNIEQIQRELELLRHRDKVVWPQWHQQQIASVQEQHTSQLATFQTQLGEAQAFNEQLREEAMARDSREQAEVARWRAARNHYNSRALVAGLLAVSVTFSATWLVFFR